MKAKSSVVVFKDYCRFDALLLFVGSVHFCFQTYRGVMLKGLTSFSCAQVISCRGPTVLSKVYGNLNLPLFGEGELYLCVLCILSEALTTAGLSGYYSQW